MACGGNFIRYSVLTLVSRVHLYKRGLRMCEYSVAASTQPSQDVLTQLENGLLKITISLPSRMERCQFTMRPVGQTLGDLLNNIHDEDKGIERLVAFLPDGDRLAKSTPLHILMGREFYLQLNDLKYSVKPPSSALSPSEHVQQLTDLQNIISQLYTASQSDQYQRQQQYQLLSKLENLKGQLEPLEQTKRQLEQDAEKRTVQLKWLGLGLMAAQFGLLARLTWWEYSWDVMEPVTYFVGYGTAIAMFAYYVVTKQEYTFADVRDRQFLLTLHRRAKRANFDVEQYNKLREQMSQVEHELQKMGDPLHLSVDNTQQQASSAQ